MRFEDVGFDLENSSFKTDKRDISVRIDMSQDRPVLLEIRVERNGNTIDTTAIDLAIVAVNFDSILNSIRLVHALACMGECLEIRRDDSRYMIRSKHDVKAVRRDPKW